MLVFGTDILRIIDRYRDRNGENRGFGSKRIRVG